MKRTYVFLIALSVIILLIGCNSGNSTSSSSNPNNTSNNQAMADWPVYDFDTLIEKTDVVAFVTVEKNEEKDYEGLPATLSTLKVTEVLYGSVPESIILNQTSDVVEPAQSYLLFLNLTGDYYYLTDGNSSIPEKDKMYRVDIPGIDGAYDKKQLIEKIEEESK